MTYDPFLFEHLESLVEKYNRPQFIELDPISIPHLYSKKQDIEIAGFLSAILSWGNRKTIINKSKELLGMMDNRPYEFIIHHTSQDLKSIQHFKHRTFNGTDALYIINTLKHLYSKSNTLEKFFYSDSKQPFSAFDSLNNFYHSFFDPQNLYISVRTQKHIAAPFKKSTCKRLNMYLRWMVRNDKKGVDFGLWKTIPTSELMIPLDVHVDNYARQLKLLTRMQRDWQTVLEITSNLKLYDPNDPVKYDFALFGLGINKNN